MSVYSFSVSKSGVYGTAYVDTPSGYVYEVGASRAPVLPSIRMMSSHSAITDARYYQLELINIYNSSGTVIGWASTNKSTSTAKGSYSASTSWQTGSAVDMPTVAELFSSSNPSAKQVSVRVAFFLRPAQLCFTNHSWREGPKSRNITGPVTPELDRQTAIMEG